MFSRNRPDRDDRANSSRGGRASYFPPRVNRASFWTVSTGAALGALIIYAVGGRHVLMPVGLSFAVVVLRLTAARLQDFGRTSWWAALPPGLLVALALTLGRLPGGLVLLSGLGLSITVLSLLIVGLMPGDEGPNRFGPPPRVRRKRNPRTAEAQPL